MRLLRISTSTVRLLGMLRVLGLLVAVVALSRHCRDVLGGTLQRRVDEVADCAKEFERLFVILGKDRVRSRWNNVR